MHNFTVPSALKAWIDHVVRPGRTFLSTPAGKVGLLADRPVMVVAAAGGRFEAGPGSQVDFLSPYLRAVFGCMGLTQVEVLRLENLRREPAAIEAARARLDDWAQQSPRGWRPVPPAGIESGPPSARARQADVAGTERALHEQGVDPLPMLEAHGLQPADHAEAHLLVQRDRAGAFAAGGTGHHRHHLAPGPLAAHQQFLQQRRPSPAPAWRWSI